MCSSEASYSKQKGQTRMDNPETLATLGKQKAGWTQTKHKTEHSTENLKDEHHGYHQKSGMNLCARKGKQFLSLIRYPPYFPHS